MMRKLLNKLCVVGTFITITSVLNGCSHFSTSTNLDRSNFNDYFSPSHVTIYKDEKDFTGAYKYLGLVEGEDCQVKAHHAKPDEIIARTNARKHADKLNANAVVFSGCALINNDEPSEQCIATTVCYGKAYFVTAK